MARTRQSLKSSQPIPPSRIRSSNRASTPNKVAHQAAKPAAISSSRDNIDPVYHNKDPIKVSIAQRIEAGQTVMS